MGENEKRLHGTGKKPSEENNGGTKPGTPRSPFLNKAALRESLAAGLADALGTLKTPKPEPTVDVDHKVTKSTPSIDKYQEQVREGHDLARAGAANGGDLEKALPTETPSETELPTVPHAQETGEPPVPSDSKPDIAGMGDEDLISHFNERLEAENIGSLEEAREKLSELVAEIEEREMVLADGDGVNGKRDSSENTAVDIVAQNPQMAEIDQQLKEAAQQNSQHVLHNDQESKKVVDPTMAPGFSPVSPLDQPAQEPPAASPPKESPAPTPKHKLTKLERYELLLNKLIEDVKNPKLRDGSAAVERARKHYDMILNGDLCKNYAVMPEDIENLPSYLQGKIKRGESIMPLEKVILKMDELRRAIDKHSPQESKEGPVSPPVLEISSILQPEPVQAVKEEEALVIKLPENGETGIGRKIKNFVFHRMTVAVVLGAAVSYLMHAQESFQDLALGINKLWENVFRLSSIKVTAQEAMIGFYTVLSTIFNGWLVLKIRKRAKLNKSVQKFKERRKAEYEYVTKALREIRDKSPDAKAQSTNLANAMVDDENLFSYLDMFYSMPNKETGESIVVSVMKETNFHVSAISNFYMVHEGAEKVIMLKRFEKLASLWVPDRMRQSKLMELWDEDPLFREKLFGLFDKNRKGGYINAKSRTKYIALNVGGISGEELLWVLEEDYNHVIR